MSIIVDVLQINNIKFVTETDTSAIETINIGSKW